MFSLPGPVLPITAHMRINCATCEPLNRVSTCVRGTLSLDQTCWRVDGNVIPWNEWKISSTSICFISTRVRVQDLSHWIWNKPTNLLLSLDCVRFWPLLHHGCHWACHSWVRAELGNFWNLYPRVFYFLPCTYQLIWYSGATSLRSVSSTYLVWPDPGNSNLGQCASHLCTSADFSLYWVWTGQGNLSLHLLLRGRARFSLNSLSGVSK